MRRTRQSLPLPSPPSSFLPSFSIGIILRGPTVCQAFCSTSLYSQFPLSRIISSYLLLTNNTILFFKTQPRYLPCHPACYRTEIPPTGQVFFFCAGTEFTTPSPSINGAFHTSVTLSIGLSPPTRLWDPPGQKLGFTYLPISRAHRAGFQEESCELKSPWT